MTNLRRFLLHEYFPVYNNYLLAYTKVTGTALLSIGGVPDEGVPDEGVPDGGDGDVLRVRQLSTNGAETASADFESSIDITMNTEAARYKKSAAVKHHHFMKWCGMLSVLVVTTLSLTI